MSGDEEKTIRKWSIIKEQLIALGALNKLPRGNDELRKLLSEDVELKNINSQNLNCICYHLLGIINSEERDKLIQWPLVNIKTNTKFRKGMSTMINIFQEKYPWSHIKKLPESYFMNPHGYQSRVVDFVLKLTNLAIHIALDDPELLFMHSGDGLTSREIAIMTEVISKTREEEEKLIKNNVLPLKDIEDVKNEVGDKCIALRQEIDDLQHQLCSLKKHAISQELAFNEKTIDVNDLKEMRNEKLLELNAINEELLKYYDLSRELLLKIKAFKNPLNLSSQDFGFKTSSPDLGKATSNVCGDLCQFFQYISLKSSTNEQENEFLEKLKTVKENMMQQNEALCSFLYKVSSI